MSHETTLLGIMHTSQEGL